MYLAHAIHIVRGYKHLAQVVHIVYCKAADLCWRVPLSQELVHRQTDRQTHGRGYMYLAHAVHIVRCKAADLRWRLSQELVHRTDRHTDVAICTWPRLYI